MTLASLETLVDSGVPIRIFLKNILMAYFHLIDCKAHSPISNLIAELETCLGIPNMGWKKLVCNLTRSLAITCYHNGV